MNKVSHEGIRTWVEIDAKAIRNNYRIFRKFIPRNVHIAGVVKSNAYGHNLAEFALELERCGVDMLAVDSLVEALSLRKAGVRTEILVLGYTLPELFSEAAKNNIHITISSKESLLRLTETPRFRKIPIHLKVDTGMHRQGFLLSELAEVMEIITESKLTIAGLYTHFASAKDPHEKTFTQKQISEFCIWKSAFEAVGLFPVSHVSATGGMLSFPGSSFDMVRVGIGMYGVWPSREIENALTGKMKLNPVLSWKTIISEFKIVSAGSGIGYDLAERVERPSKIAVCPIGYWHGYPRALSNKSEVLVRGVRAKVLGRVSMDMIVIDITDVPRVKVGDEVVLIGSSCEEEITAKELAEIAGTTAYEILTRINPLIKRIYK